MTIEQSPMLRFSKLLINIPLTDCVYLIGCSFGPNNKRPPEKEVVLIRTGTHAGRRICLNYNNQRVLNDLLKTRLSRRRRIWLLFHSLSRQQLSSQSSCCQPSLLLWGGDVGGAKSYDDETAWSSINHSILSDIN